ncbi:T9SS type A sorting domain-containing protein [Rubrivirga sp.]|uniref:T9SS type A sorting domain-containing protein n=1 Tax=Rubrivirga sp. TaxID=1885344 RepID=UPI003B517FAF
MASLLALLVAFAAPSPSAPFAGCHTQTGTSAVIIVPASPSVEIPSGPIQPGDAIGVYGPDGSCVGWAQWDGQALALSVWADDPVTPSADGFLNGDVPEFRVYDASTSTTYVGDEVAFAFEPFAVVSGGLAAEGVYVVAEAPETGTSLVVTGNTGVRYFGVPAKGVTVDDLARQTLVRGVPGYYPDASFANLWTGYDAVTGDWAASSGAGEVIELGRAFRWLVYDRVFGDPEKSASVGLPFTLTTELPANTDDVEVELNTEGSRFTFLANPFGKSLDLTDVHAWPGSENLPPFSPVWVYDAATRSWEASPESIGPWEAFRVRSKGSRRNDRPRTLTIPYAVPTSNDLVQDEEEVRLSFWLEGMGVDGDPVRDGAMTFAFFDTAQPAFDIGEDAEKFQPMSETYALVGARNGWAFLGHDARPLEVGEISLAMETRGTLSDFTLHWASENLPLGTPMSLVDLATGAVVDLHTASEYGFTVAPRPSLPEALESDFANGAAAQDRFVLRIGSSLATGDEGPAQISLSAPTPNPFAGSTRLTYETPEAGPVRVSVYDVRGREVAVLEDRPVQAGRHDVQLDAQSLSAGVYMVRLEATGHVLTRQAVVVR